MNAIYIITTYVMIDDAIKLMNIRDHHHATLSTAEILTVAVIAAKYFHNHHERALVVLQMTGYLPAFSISRFNRRLHHAADTLLALLDDGFPIAFDIVPAVWHELTTLQAITGDLPSGSTVYGDGAYISVDHSTIMMLSHIKLIAQAGTHMHIQNSAAELVALRKYRSVIENAHSVLERMGVQRLHAVTQAGFGIKVHASLLALAINVLSNDHQFTSN